MSRITKTTKSFLSSGLMLLATFSSSVAVAQNDDLMRNLFQNLQNWLGLAAVENRDYENRLRAVPPPYYEQSAISGNYILAAEDTQGMKDLQEFLSSRAIDWNMLQPKDAVGNEKIVQQHLLGFCSEEEAKARICERGVAVQQGGAADLLAETLFSNDTLSEEDQLAVWAFIDNILNPVPVYLDESIVFEGEDFSADALPTLADSPMSRQYESVRIRPITSEGINSLAGRYKQMAFLSTAQNALNKIAADRHVVRGLGEKVGMDQQDASIFAALKFEANRRYGDENWHKEMNVVPAEAALREMNNSLAFLLALEFKRYEQEQIMISLLAAQVAYYSQIIGQGETAMMQQVEY